jgi:hypothetical protein
VVMTCFALHKHSESVTREKSVSIVIVDAYISGRV